MESNKKIDYKALCEAPFNNDCVSLEGWAVLDRLLRKRFGWMEMLDPGLVYETKLLAKAQLEDAMREQEEQRYKRDPA